MMAFCAVLVRVGTLQIADAADLSAAGLSQRVRPDKLPADRGAILDRNGINLALSVPQNFIYADPLAVKDKAGAARALAPLLGVDEATLERQLNGKGRFVYLAHEVTDQITEALKALKAVEPTKALLTGIEALPEPKRFYPSGDVARSVLGDVAVGGIGSAGLEQLFDAQLQGKEGELRREVDGNGRTIPSGESEYVAPTPGHQIVTTLDRNLQYFAEQALIGQVDAVRATGGMVVVEEVGTGNILAMANVQRDAKGVATTKANLSITAPFEPGSIMKVVTMATALEAGLVTPETQIPVPNRYVYDKGSPWEKAFKDAEDHPDAVWSVQHIFAQSSNVGTIKVAEKLGREGLDAGLRNFGFGQRTAVSLPNESKGLYPPLSKWSNTSLPTMAIGQGLSVTALQMLSAYEAVANGGVSRTPRIVAATIDPDGSRHDVPIPAGRRVVSAQTAATMNQMMQDVVKEGTGTNAAIPGYTVAGKTGTALKAQSNGTYLDANNRAHYTSSFAGFVPAEAPKLAILVVIDDPGAANAYYAAEVAAPLFQKVGQESLRQLRIPPIAATEIRDQEPPAAAAPTAATGPR